MTEEKLNEQLAQLLEEQKREMQKPNLLIVGGTGVGKSSLVNCMFGKELAEVGTGKPVTKGLNKYEQDNFPLVIYDAEGYEIGSDGTENRGNFEQNVIPRIEEMNKKELKGQIHLVWYCISIANHRVTEYDLENINYFVKHNMKTAVVFTKCDIDDEDGSDAKKFMSVINEKNPNLAHFETCTTDKNLKLDLDKLIDWSIEKLPNEQLKASFIQAQLVSIPKKKEKAYAILVATVTTTATTAGLNPIPVSDALLIVPQQMAMCVKINKIFWPNSAFIDNMDDILKTQLMSMVGKQMAASLIKLIPGVGQLVNAGVAGLLTGAFGVALIESHSLALSEYLKNGTIPNWTKILSSSYFSNLIKEAWNNKLWENRG